MFKPFRTTAPIVVEAIEVNATEEWEV